MSIKRTIMGWWKSAVTRAREALDRLPPIDVLWRERRAYASALIALGDKAAALEPEALADLDLVRYAARAIEFAAGSEIRGADKAQLVLDQVRKAWGVAGIADSVFDSWWAEIARPFLDAYVRQVNDNEAWIPPT